MVGGLTSRCFFEVAEKRSVTIIRIRTINSFDFDNRLDKTCHVVGFIILKFNINLEMLKMLENMDENNGAHNNNNNRKSVLFPPPMCSSWAPERWDEVAYFLIMFSFIHLMIWGG